MAVAGSVELLNSLLAVPPDVRDDIFREVGPKGIQAAMMAAQRDLGTPYALWADDPIGFVSLVLGEFAWSKQREIALSVRDNQRTVVPASHSPGKTHWAARLVAWWCAVHPVGTAVAVTTAPRMRQVKMQLWPHIGRAVDHGRLPGTVDMTQWKMTAPNGRREEVVSYGFSAPDWDEDAMQGIHAEHVLLIVDEAGGISHTLGKSIESLTTGLHSRVLAIGNPPTDDEGSWFERISEESPLWHTIRIDAYSTPNFTGEPVPEHVAAQLVGPQWVDDVVAEYGEDDNFVQARVHARFVRGGVQKVLPVSWIEAAEDTDEDETRDGWVRLGVDVASDGGDELAIVRLARNVARLVFHRSGEANAHPVDVAGVVLEHIHEAEALAKALGSKRRVRVKVDAIGVGWGVWGLLDRWQQEGIHNAEVVAVNVAETALEPERFANKRAEAWWALRKAIQPDAAGVSTLRLEVDQRTKAQLAGPTFKHTSAGKIQIESKPDMRKRGLPSPDRADAFCLAVYEPAPPPQADYALPSGQLPKVTPGVPSRFRPRGYR